MDEQIAKAQRLASKYLSLWENMKTDLLSRQGAIKTLSDKETSIQAAGRTSSDAARILDELEKQQTAMHDTSSGYFRHLREVIQDVPHGYERFFWESVSPIVLVLTK